jgi:hypothetical protein
MGWASGSEIAESIWDAVKKSIPKKDQKKVAKKIIEIFENNDCDTIEEAEELYQAAGRKYEERE